MPRIQYNKLNIFGCGPVDLLPGINTISEADYLAAKDNPGWIDRVANGSIVVLDAAVHEPIVSAPVEVEDPPAPVEEVDPSAEIEPVEEVTAETDAPVRSGRGRK